MLKRLRQVFIYFSLLAIPLVLITGNFFHGSGTPFTSTSMQYVNPPNYFHIGSHRPRVRIQSKHPASSYTGIVEFEKQLELAKQHINAFMQEINSNVSNATISDFHQSESAEINGSEVKSAQPMRHAYVLPIADSQKSFYVKAPSRPDVPIDANTLQQCLKMVEHRKYDCQPLRFAVTPNSLTAITGFPTSGITRVRHLIQQLTGIYTGSVYYNPCLKENGFAGENVTDRSVMAIKTYHAGKIKDNFQKAVLVIRNPYDAIRGEWNRLRTVPVATVSKKEYKLDKWEDFVAWAIHTRITHFLDWIRFPGPLLVIRYEDLQKNLQRQLNRILVFFGSMAAPDVVDCIVNKNPGELLQVSSENVHHGKQEGENFTPFLRHFVEMSEADLNYTLRLRS